MKFVIRSALLRAARAVRMRVAARFYVAFEQRAQTLFNEAVARAKANKRRTLMPQDV